MLPAIILLNSLRRKLAGSLDGIPYPSTRYDEGYDEVTLPFQRIPFGVKDAGRSIP